MERQYRKTCCFLSVYFLTLRWQIFKIGILETYQYVLAIIGGIAAGFINTLAGNGSVITLPLLMWLGLDATFANATNRVGTFAQSTVAFVTLIKKGNVKFDKRYWLTVPAFIGAIVGALIAVDIEENYMRYAIGIVMALLIIPTSLNAKKWLRKDSIIPQGKINPLYFLLFFLVGIYGGFIQAGIGVITLVIMVLGMKFNLYEANVLKNFMVFCFSFPVLAIFIYNGQVDWKLGGLLVIGHSTGAWIAATFAAESKKANLWIRRLLVVVILITVWKMFGIGEILGLPF